MARPRSFASVALCLCVSTTLATPAQASPHARVSLTAVFAPGGAQSSQGSLPPAGAMKISSSNLHVQRENAPTAGASPGLPFAPTGWRWRQPRIHVQTEPVPLAAGDASTTPTTPFLVVRTPSGRPLVLAVTPPDEPLPTPRPARLSPVLPLGVGAATFVFSYLATWAHTDHFREDCALGKEDACRRASTMMIPVAGPLLGERSRHPEYYVLSAFQAAGLLTVVIGAVLLLHDQHRRRALAAGGIHLARNTAIRLDGGLAGGRVTIDARF